MSKIICDVCGTAYPETAAQCPICGSAKNANAKTVDTPEAEGGASYQYVRGGRFSKRNVKKRNKESQAKQVAAQTVDTDDSNDENKTNKGLVVLLIVVLAAVLAVVIYIALKFFMPGPSVPSTEPSNTTVPSTSSTASTDPDGTSEPTVDTEPSGTTEAVIPCTSLMIHNPQVTLEEIGNTAKIEVKLSPADTTETVTYTSSNEAVAVVDEFGYVTAVGPGDATVSVTCGIFTVKCNVTVPGQVTEPSTEPSTEPTEPSTDPAWELKLYSEDISFFSEGESWRLYTGSLPQNQVRFSSDDETVATFENGVVTAVGPGVTTVHAEYDGTEVSCIIRCRWEAQSTEPTDPATEPTEGGSIEEGVYSLYINGSLPSELYGADVSLNVNDSFQLTVVSPSGNTVSVTWTASADGIVSISGNTVTGTASGVVNVSAEYNGQTFTCIVRVK